MNVSRLIASVGGYFVSTSNDAIALHLYGGATVKAEFAGSQVTLHETSNYPWDGQIAISLETTAPVDFELCLRVPGWCKDARLHINGIALEVNAHLKKGYVRLRQRWQSGDRIELELPMPAHRTYAHPAVKADRGKVALECGPLVYCLEQVDNPGVAIFGVGIAGSAGIESIAGQDELSGITLLEVDATVSDATEWGTVLYRDRPAERHVTRIRAVPYYFWANREAGAMSVWIAGN